MVKASYLKQCFTFWKHISPGYLKEICCCYLVHSVFLSKKTALVNGLKCSKPKEICALRRQTKSLSIMLSPLIALCGGEHFSLSRDIFLPLPFFAANIQAPLNIKRDQNYTWNENCFCSCNYQGAFRGSFPSDYRLSPQRLSFEGEKFARTVTPSVINWVPWHPELLWNGQRLHA